MRDIKELVILLRDYTKKINGEEFSNMCRSISVLKQNKKITNIEYCKIYLYIKNNKPKTIVSNLWWHHNDKKNRIEWLNEQINNL